MTEPPRQPDPYSDGNGAADGADDAETSRFPPAQDGGAQAAYPAYGPQGPPPGQGAPWSGTGGPDPMAQQAWTGWDPAGRPPQQSWAASGSPWGPGAGGEQWGPGGEWDPAAAEARSGNRRKGPIITAAVGSVVLVAAIVLILGFVWPRFFVTTVLDHTAAEAAIAQVLRDDYGMDGVTAVTCPADVTVASGHRFVCDAVVSGQTMEIISTFTGNGGDYIVSQPS